jgi:hypothetical protein
MADSEDVKKLKRYEFLKRKSEKVELDRNEVINILTIIEGFKRKLQAELKKQA